MAPFHVIVIGNSLIQEWELLRTLLLLFVEFSNSFDKHYLSILISWLVVSSKPSCVNKEFENFSVNFPPEYSAWNKNPNRSSQFCFNNYFIDSIEFWNNCRKFFFLYLFHFILFYISFCQNVFHYSCVNTIYCNMLIKFNSFK